MALLEVNGLSKRYELDPGLLARVLSGGRTRVTEAVSDVSFALNEGEVLGIVGESGCGKSTTCDMIAGLTKPTSGTICFRGQNIVEFSAAALRRYRRHVQIIFQDPFESLNPRLRVFDQVAEGPRALRLWNEAEIERRVLQMLVDVGLPPAIYHRRFPHQMSGGERQRVGIAAALVTEPELVIADEPLSMLDVSIRAGILDLLSELSKRRKFSVIYVSHDLSIMRGFVQELIVMYLGQIVEMGRFSSIMTNPRHPYTAALIAAVPVPDPLFRRPVPDIIDDIARPLAHDTGCRFLPRCRHATEICTRHMPALVPSFPAEHSVRCYLHQGPQ
jgi:peptide/nickel transport system ATP-binding protein